MTRTSLSSIVAAAVFATVCLAQAASQKAASSAASPSAVSAQNGKKVYERVGCYECHGHEGQGGSAGKRIAPKPIAWEDFSLYCRRPSGEMPPYSMKIVSDAELADIYAFLQSVPNPPSAKTNPLFNEDKKKGGR